MSLLHLEGIQSWLRGHMLCHVSGVTGRFALTFDDGPSPRNTPRMLEVLARYGAQATFFTLSHRVCRHRALAERILAEGHEIGLHGGLHVPPWSMPRRRFEREVKQAFRIVQEVTGVRPTHYRAPFGLLFAHQAAWVREWGLNPVLGDVFPRDHATRRSELIAGRVLARLEPGAIVILHDASTLGDTDRGHTIEAVASILEEAASRGLEAVSVSKLMHSRGE